MNHARAAAMLSFSLLLMTASQCLVVPDCLAADEHPKRRMRHFVAFKFKDTATAAQKKLVEESFVALKTKIPQIARLEWGTNDSPEKLNKGLTTAFLLTFKTPKDRDAYLVHPEHLKFKKSALPVVADVLVLDFVGTTAD